MISVRLTEELERKLDRIARDKNVSKSKIVKEALESYLEKDDGKPTAYELGKDLFGKHGSGLKNLSRDHKKIFVEILREKHSH